MSLPQSPEELRGLCVEFPPRTFTPDLRGLVAWLETQEPTQTYKHGSHNDCLLCRFVTVLDGKPPERFKRVLDIWGYSGPIYEAAYGDYRQVHTYALALSRARQLLASAPCT